MKNRILVAALDCIGLITLMLCAAVIFQNRAAFMI